MPEQAGERVFLNTRSYDCQVIIKDTDYTADLDKVRIVSSLTAPYQSIYLDVFIDQNDIILSKLYGQDKIKLKIRLLEQTKFVKEQIDFELIYISSNYSLVMKEQLSEGKQKDRIPVSILAVPRIPLRTASTFVNKIYFNKTAKEIIEDLTSSFTDASIDVDTDGVNDLNIDQCCIPPTTLIKAFSYVDRTFGVFDGPYVHFIDRDNKIHIMNLNKKFNKDQAFTVYHLAQRSGAEDIIDKCNDGKNFYTLYPINSDYSGNTMYSILAKKQRFIVKPRDTLFHLIEHDMDNIISEYGAIWKNPKSYVDEEIIKDRTKYYIKDTGYDYDDSFSISTLTKILSQMSSIDILLERNLPILKLMEIGRNVKLVEQHNELTDISGKYILRSSDLSFKKGDDSGADWEATAAIKLIRTNKTI